MTNSMSSDPLNDDLLLSVLQQTKEQFWTANAHLPANELQRDWEARGSLIRSILDSTNPLQPGATSMATVPDTPKRPREEAVPTGGPAKRIRSTQSSREGNGPAQQPSQMSRRSSRVSHRGSSPSCSTQGIMSPFPLNTWLVDDQPFSLCNSVNNPPRAPRALAGSRQSRLLSVTTYDDPADFYSPTSSQPSPMTSQGQGPLRPSNALSSSPSQLTASMFSSSFSPSASAYDSQTNPTSVNMSRQTSFAGTSFSTGFELLRLNSQSSNVDSSSPMPNPNQQLSPTSEHLNHLTCHVGGSACEMSLSPNDFSSTSILDSTVDADLNMRRSDSNISTTSRLSRRFQEQAISSSRPIAPKADGTTPMSVPSLSSSGHKMIRKQSLDGSYRDAIEITKAPYVRPYHEKVKCDQCNEQPDGFKGDHELRRHVDRAHRARHRVWVCKDISEGQTFLAGCKACEARKPYNAYYNAAAHLRRTHWNKKPKQPRKRKLRPEERRGGKAGGHEPSMSVLKQWMESFEAESFEVDSTTVPDHGNDEYRSDDRIDTAPAVAAASTTHNPAVFEMSTDAHVNDVSHRYGRDSVPVSFNTDVSQLGHADHSHTDLSEDDIKLSDLPFDFDHFDSILTDQYPDQSFTDLF